MTITRAIVLATAATALLAPLAGQARNSEVFIDGWLNNGKTWGRPVDVLQLDDGSLLVSDDHNGLIYRVTYNGSSAAVRPPVRAIHTALGKKPRQPLRGAIAGLHNPESAVATVKGRLFVSDAGKLGTNGDGQIVEITANGTIKPLIGGLDDPKGLDFGNGGLIVVDKTRVIKVGLDGSSAIIADATAFPGTPTAFHDVEIGPKGRLYVSDSGDRNGEHAAVYRIGPQGRITQLVSSHNSAGLKRPAGLLLDRDGTLFVTDMATGRLFRLDPVNGHLTLLTKGFGAADGIARDFNGRLYISDRRGGRLYALDSVHGRPKPVADGLGGAADIAPAAGAGLVVADSTGGKIVLLSLDALYPSP